MNRRKNKGFSLVEVLVAAGLLAVATVTICTLGAKSLSAMQICQEYEKAWDVLDRQMVLFEQVGAANLADQANLSGVIDDPQSPIQWRWRLSIEPFGVEELYALTLTVEWDSEGRTRRIQCDTSLRAVEDAATTTTGTTATTGTGTTSTATTTTQSNQ
jgi:prepilin-type N-terminal cleavage/methylation domain-containing protein